MDSSNFWDNFFERKLRNSRNFAVGRVTPKPDELGQLYGTIQAVWDGESITDCGSTRDVADLASRCGQFAIPAFPIICRHRSNAPCLRGLYPHLGLTLSDLSLDLRLALLLANLGAVYQAVWLLSRDYLVAVLPT